MSNYHAKRGRVLIGDIEVSAAMIVAMDKGWRVFSPYATVHDGSVARRTAVDDWLDACEKVVELNSADDRSDRRHPDT